MSYSECNHIEYTVWSEFLVVTNVSMIIIAFYFTIQFIHKEKGHKKILYRIGSVFCIISLMVFISSLAISMTCLYGMANLSSAFESVALAFWVPQLYLLLLLFFLTVHHVFNGTAYAFSKCTLFIVKFLFVAIVVFVVTMFVAHAVFGRLSPLAALSALSTIFCVITLMLFLVITVIKNLIKLYHGNDEGITNIITKTTILTIVSIISTIVSVILSFMRVKGNVILWGFAYCAWCIDTFTNFLCIILTYKSFNNHYNKLCGFAHKKCKLCMIYCIDSESSAQTQLSNDVASNSKISTSNKGSETSEATSAATSGTTSVATSAVKVTRATECDLTVSTNYPKKDDSSNQRTITVIELSNPLI